MTIDADVKPNVIDEGRLRRCMAILAVSSAVLLVASLLAGVPASDGGGRDGPAAPGTAAESTADQAEPSAYLVDGLDRIIAAKDKMAALSERYLDAETRRALANRVTVPIADTVFMRRLSLFPLVDQTVMQRFQAVAISNDPAFREHELRRLLAEPDAVVRYRALLELFRTRVRSRDGNIDAVARDHLRAALVLPVEPEMLKTDAWFLTAVDLSRQGRLEDARRAIDRALGLDPLSLNGHWERITILANLLAGPGQSFRPGERAAALADMLASLGQLAVLAQTGNILTDLLAASSGLPRNRDETTSLALGYVHFLAGRPEEARRSLVRVVDACGAERTCDARLLRTAQALLTGLPVSSESPASMPRR